MHVTTDLANRAYDILCQHFAIARSDPAQRYFRETVMIKKKCNLAEISGEGLVWWNLRHNQPPFIEYSGKDGTLTPAVAAANNDLRTLFPV